MKKLTISSVIVALGMIGFVAVLWILPHRDTCCAHGTPNSCSRGGHENGCRMETNTCDDDGRMRKEVRVVIGDGPEGCMNMDSGSCQMHNDQCMMMNGSDHMMMNGGCCCCCMMHGGGMMMPCKGDSMKVMIKIDSSGHGRHGRH